jgi:hypothetical protein
MGIELFVIFITRGVFDLFYKSLIAGINIWNNFFLQIFFVEDFAKKKTLFGVWRSK